MALWTSNPKVKESRDFISILYPIYSLICTLFLFLCQSLVWLAYVFGTKIQIIYERIKFLYSTAEKSLDTFTLSGKDNLVEYLTHLAFNVTAWHEMVGTISQYVTPPSGFGFSLRPGKAVLDVQSFVQVHSSA